MKWKSNLNRKFSLPFLCFLRITLSHFYSEAAPLLSFRMTVIQCKGVLFDLDGVLADSTPAVARVWTIWANKHGFDPEETVRRAHGRPSITTIRELLPNADHASENAAVERMEIDDVGGIVALPGAVELLQALPSNHWTIVTSCTRALALIRLRAAGLPIPAKLITANDITHGKPHPEPYWSGAESLGAKAEDCVVFEDAPAGIRSGKAAGARVVALQTTERLAFLREAGADWIVKDCASVRAQNWHAGGEIRLILSGTA
jgi:mannitol-1-/sugar-/sorbitol-6-phosphatase